MRTLSTPSNISKLGNSHDIPIRSYHCRCPLLVLQVKPVVEVDVCMLFLNTRDIIYSQNFSTDRLSTGIVGLRCSDLSPLRVCDA